jgi:O-succinylbenzoate synthase
MKIQRVDLIVIRMSLVTPFETSSIRHSDLEKLILKVHTPDGTAYSECVAGSLPLYSPETISTSKDILKNNILPLLMGKDINGPDEYLKVVAPIKGHPMAKAAMENALWILQAVEEGESLAIRIGGEKKRIVSGVSIGIQEQTEQLIELIAAYIDKGYPRIKIKIKPGKDIRVLEEVRKHFPDISLMVDANNAYSLLDIAIFKAMDNYELLMIEQPLAHDNLVDHASLLAQIKTPICLDESITSPSLTRTALALNACQIINIKQGRVGGLLQAKKVYEIAGSYNKGVWCGGMLETGIGRAVNVALASMQNFNYPSDISASSRYWEQDIIDPEFMINSDGTLDVPSQPGLGVEINEKILNRLVLHREAIRL